MLLLEGLNKAEAAMRRTLNVCLRRTPDVEGSRVFFYADGEAESPPIYAHVHAVGRAVLHCSKAWHKTEPLTAGERGSVIMWFRAAVD